MKFTIISPTIQRPSLLRCCESVSVQTHQSFEHIVQVDCAEYDMALITAIEEDPRRAIYKCPVSHKNFGNTCRGLAWMVATGDWVLHLDCDNYLADDHVLEDLAAALVDVEEKWAIFPILRFGQRFFYDPPGCCSVDTLNMVIRREVAQWPDGSEYAMDGLFCEQLKARHPWKSFPSFRPIGVMESSGNGR